ncbi:hypothetical protein [Pseudobutyrivibrio sp.]|uniref:hypothetical protein n=1 Tax=Pseudobutyrivibrio sp. TaxID=2014367 RepID=UPI001D8D1322|nr:hypothetical protein [Pseudobutyrivibrio sp.]MBE5910892.1 hypothetical protein [Pseudobutyrivibrio sp.]
MFKANTIIIAGNTTYTEGQVVSGLSSIDEEWMKNAGLISEVPAKTEKSSKASKKEEKSDE